MSKQYLIINLRRFGDILTSAHLVSVLKKQEPDCQISYLVYEESRRAAAILADVTNIFTLDRKKILSLSKNKLFSPAYSLNEFADVLEEIQKTKWTKVINTSNDKVSAAIVSYLSFGEKENFAGIRFDENFNTEASGAWATTFNDVVTSYKHTPAHFVDCFLGMSGVFQKEIPVANLHTNPEYDKSVRENFAIIQNQVSQEEMPVKIVGIQLKASQAEKEIPLNSLVDFIGYLLDDPRFYPVLLIGPFPEERAYANELNELFSQSLIVIEADFLAMNSVLKHLSVLVTPDTVIKHQAELVGTPLVEVSLGASPFLRQGPVRSGNLVLTPTLKQRTWFEKNDLAFQAYISGDDLLLALELRLGLTELSKGHCLSSHVALYEAKRSERGTEYFPVLGETNTTDEFTRKMARAYLLRLVGETINIDADLSMSEAPLNEWCSSQKVQIGKFSVEELVNYCHSDKLSALAFLFFRAELEQMKTQDSIGNLVSKLKQNIELLTGVLQNVEEQVQIKRRIGYSSLKSTEGNYGTDTD